MCFLINKKIVDDKKSYLYDKFFVSNQNFTTEKVKVDKNSRFLQVFWSNFQVFQVFFPNFINSRFYQVFPNFQVKVWGSFKAHRVNMWDRRTESCWAIQKCLIWTSQPYYGRYRSKRHNKVGCQQNQNLFYNNHSGNQPNQEYYRLGDSQYTNKGRDHYNNKQIEGYRNQNFSKIHGKKW